MITIIRKYLNMPSVSFKKGCMVKSRIINCRNIWAGRQMTRVAERCRKNKGIIVEIGDVKRKMLYTLPYCR